MIKLIAADMDGTLLNEKHDISKENLKAIKKAQKMGIHFSIATGRAYEDIKPFLDKHNLECECIAVNGGEYRNKKGNILKVISIDKNKVPDILDIMDEDGVTVEIYTDKGFYTTNTMEETLIGMKYRVQTFFPGINSKEISKKVKENNHFVNLNYINNIDEFLNTDVKIGKFIAFHSSEDKIVKLKNKLDTIDGLAVSSSFVTNVEVNDIQAQKGIILAKVTEEMNIKKEEVMVIGDGANDYSMFTEFPTSFAMGNAIPQIKKAAKYITDTNVNDGVAKAIYRALRNNF
ncbi:MAG: Cof-type HAD-IIB family hydrolase [Clostridium sp.]|nr:Cof-type HAD-IIB family hydrolase [Clostridium sp.]